MGDIFFTKSGGSLLVKVRGFFWGGGEGGGELETNSPGSDITSAINCVILHGGDKSVVKLTKTTLVDNVFLVTSSTQPNGTRNSEKKSAVKFKCLLRNDSRQCKTETSAGARSSDFACY